MSDKPNRIAVFDTPSECFAQRFQPLLVLLAKASFLRAVNVEHAENAAIYDKRNDDFRSRCSVANNVSVEFLHIGNP